MHSTRDICIKYGAIPCPCDDNELLELADNTIGELPVNGRRLIKSNNHSGWQIWCGPKDSLAKHAKFRDLPAFNIRRSLAEATPFLALPPGFCFLIAGGYHKVWFDNDLISTKATIHTQP